MPQPVPNALLPAEALSVLSPVQSRDVGNGLIVRRAYSLLHNSKAAAACVWALCAGSGSRGVWLTAPWRDIHTRGGWGGGLSQQWGHLCTARILQVEIGQLTIVMPRQTIPHNPIFHPTPTSQATQGPKLQP